MKIRYLNWNSIFPSQKKQVLKRPTQLRKKDFTERVRNILESVRNEGDKALFRFTSEFDEVQVSDLRVSPEEIQAAYQQVSQATLSALKDAIQRISRFHEAQMPKPISIETSKGILCERRFIPIDRVGLYIPAGTAPLPSTVLMLGIPSRIAGCKQRILVTPPRKDKTIDPNILVAADLVGIHEIYKIGGAQAIGALAYGTESIAKVLKIFGPGNSWVTEAKLQVSLDPEGASSDLPAGPSEVMVIGDEKANPAFVAADLLSQAEHGSDSQVIFVSTSKQCIDRVQVELEYQLQQLPRRALAEASLENSLLIEVKSIQEALEICNDYAPEHLILQIQNAREFSFQIESAGSVFLGEWTPESAGDYASGTNHVLPTSGFAKASSGLTTESFMKTITFQEITQQGLSEIGPTLSELARIEGLDGHRNSVLIRTRENKQGNTFL